ncbi:MAG: DUF2510 domain-containing protein, partial [Arachnia sp.]
MSSSAESPPAGWYPDPAGSDGQRYWDGAGWSQVTRPSNTSPGDYIPEPGQSSVYSSYAQAQTTQSIDDSRTQWGQESGVSGTNRQPVLAGFWWRVLATIIDA